MLRIASLLLLMVIGSQSILAEAMGKDRYYLSESYIKSEIEQMHSCVDVRYEPSMRQVVEMYATSQETPRLLARAEQYFPIFETLLDAYGLPQELKYLSVIESSLKPQVKSRAGAVGLWQFMRGTAQMMGLKVHSGIDQRMDPWASTEAAILYLSDLYSQYGDWALALAAYNCGPGNVNKAIRLSGSRDFWTLKRYLPRETRRYVPKFIAASYFLENYHMYGVEIDPQAQYATRLAVMQVFHKTNIHEIAEVLGMDKSELAGFNPAYKQRYIPASSAGYNVMLPEHLATTYMGMVSYDADIELLPRLREVRGSGLVKSNFALEDYKVIVVEEVNTKHHYVERGDNLYTLARSYGINLYELKRQNGLSKNLIKPGQRLSITKKEKVRKYIPIVHVPDELPTGEISPLKCDHVQEERMSMRQAQMEYLSELDPEPVVSAADMKKRRRSFLMLEFED